MANAREILECLAGTWFCEMKANGEQKSNVKIHASGGTDKIRANAWKCNRDVTRCMSSIFGIAGWLHGLKMRSRQVCGIQGIVL